MRLALALLILGLAAPAAAQFSEVERKALAEPFLGVTTDGQVVPDLFALATTGVSTAPVKDAAEAFLAVLTPAQRQAVSFPVDDEEWRRWANVHRYARQGVGFAEMTEAQREAAFGLLRAGLSAKGLKTSRDIMRLNERLAELTNKRVEYGEHLYWLTVMGTPSMTEPWGWQLDGHHLIVNYFVLGDQVVMTPTFMGSEPIFADGGKYAGTRVLETQEAKGLALINALTEAQRAVAILAPTKDANQNQAELFKDNLVLPTAGIRADALTPAQRGLLRELIAEYVGAMADGHARVRMDEVDAHFRDIHFAWIGGTAPDSVFYYRVHGPVILIEFDHQRPVALPGERVPTRDHVHTVVRTPNGNDYGKDLLRRHLEAHHNDAKRNDGTLR